MKNKWVWFFLMTWGFSQYTEEWQIAQDEYENGILFFDMNEDGYADITKTFWNLITVFNGANDYEIIWSVYDALSENLVVWNLYDFNNDGDKTAIITGSNYYNSVDFHLLAYSVFGSEPEWTSTSYEGSLSSLNASELDLDDGKELIFGINRYDEVDSSYYFTIKVLDGETGEEEWSLQEQQGYVSGPYIGDLDGDNTNEILLNVYDYKDENYYMSVWSFTGGMQAVTPSAIAENYTVSNSYPNPFNPNTVLPIVLNNQSELSITVVNVQGQLVQTVVNGIFSSGRYRFSWDGKSQLGELQSSGGYFFLINIDGNQIKRPMVLMK